MKVGNKISSYRKEKVKMAKDILIFERRCGKCQAIGKEMLSQERKFPQRKGKAHRKG